MHLLSILFADPDVDQRVKHAFFAFYDKACARLQAQEFVEIMKDHAGQVIVKGLQELDSQ